MSERKHRRNPEKEAFWKQTVEEQLRSGLSVRAYCRRKRLSEASFYAWRRKLKLRQQEREMDHGRRPSAKATFLPVTLAHVAAAIELVLPSGVLLRLPAATELSAVATLVADLERRAC